MNTHFKWLQQTHTHTHNSHTHTDGSIRDNYNHLPSSAISPFVILFTRSPGDDGRFGSENVTFKMETTRNEINFRLQTQ